MVPSLTTKSDNMLSADLLNPSRFWVFFNHAFKQKCGNVITLSVGDPSSVPTLQNLE